MPKKPQWNMFGKWYFIVWWSNHAHAVCNSSTLCCAETYILSKISVHLTHEISIYWLYRTWAAYDNILNKHLNKMCRCFKLDFCCRCLVNFATNFSYSVYMFLKICQDPSFIIPPEFEFTWCQIGEFISGLFYSDYIGFLSPTPNWVCLCFEH